MSKRTYNVLVHKLSLGRKYFGASFVIDEAYADALQNPKRYRRATLIVDPVKPPQAQAEEGMTTRAELEARDE